MNGARARAVAAGIAAAAMVTALAGCADTPPAPSPTLAPFLIDQDFADPGLLDTGGTYVAFASNTPGFNIQVATSDNLTDWDVAVEDALPGLPAWANEGRTWAPGVSALPDGGFVMYFTAAHTASDKQCIGVATSAVSTGPYQPVEGDPIVCTLDEGGAIDASVFTDDDGTRYLLWKNDGNCCGLETWIQLAPLTADGTGLAAPATKLFAPSQDWEDHLVEAPVLIKRGSTYHVFYSANDYSSENYAIGVASASSITGPYTSRPEPLLSTGATDDGYLGPGGQDIVSTSEGDVLLFHAWDELFIYRGMHSLPLDWDGDVPSVRLPVGGVQDADSPASVDPDHVIIRKDS